MTYTLHLGDCLEYLRTLPDKVAQLAFVDPPYNVGMDYGATYDDSRPLPEYFAWCEEWLTELRRVAVQVAVYPPKIHLRKFWEWLPENHLVICGWSPAGAIRGKYIHQYAPLLLPPKPVVRIADHWWNPQMPGLGYFYRETRYGNPGQTSLDVTQRIVRAFSVEGDTVIDCFAGVGTTAVVCVQNNRSFLGSEKNPDYYAIAQKRIEDAAAQLHLFEVAA